MSSAHKAPKTKLITSVQGILIARRAYPSHSIQVYRVLIALNYNWPRAKFSIRPKRTGNQENLKRQLPAPTSQLQVGTSMLADTDTDRDGQGRDGRGLNCR